MQSLGSSGHLAGGKGRKATSASSGALKVFLFGVLVGSLVSGFFTMGLSSHMLLSRESEDVFEDEGLLESPFPGGTVKGTDEIVEPHSYTIRGAGGALCTECEDALSRASDEAMDIREKLSRCEKESMERDEAEFKQEDAAAIKEDIDVFVGIQTGFSSDRDKGTDFDYSDRRRVIRKTWFKSQDPSFMAMLKKHAIVVKFVIGFHENDMGKEESDIEKEISKYGDIVRLSVTESYENLVEKSYEYFRWVIQHYNPKYIIKVDDDVYLKLNRIPAAVTQWYDQNVDYTGCMKTGPIQKDPKYKWFEPQHVLLGDESYFAHTWGSIYVLSGRAARAILDIKKESLRYLANEDVTLGSWLLALKMNHYDDRRMCENHCGRSGIALIDIPHPGLEPVKKRMLELHESDECRADENDFEAELLPMVEVLHFTAENSQPMWAR